MYRPDIKLVVILSLPRSGSTVLAAELDRRQGVVSVPETYFPGAVEYAVADARRLDGCLAELFAVCSDAGAPLSVTDLAPCINSADWRRTLIDIGLRIAERTGRCPGHVTAVVYKTTRLVSFTKLLQDAGARFIILRRDARNVFESQFRVDFGIHNRNALRFALFHESYESAFASLPKDRVLDVEYHRIPEALPDIVQWMSGSKHCWTNAESSHAVAAELPWHTGLLGGFHDADERKRATLSRSQQACLRVGLACARLLRPVLGYVRLRGDRRLAERLLQRARCFET